VVSVPTLRTSDKVWRIGVVNGTNMPNLINRNPAVFGTPQTIDDLESWLVDVGRALGVEVHAMHSNHDGEIIEWINAKAFGGHVDAFIINPAGLTTYAEHVRHCLEETRLPYGEVHYANLAKSGHHSVFTRTALGIACGFRKHSYTGALVALAGVLDEAPST
jgi:3-dehydroquinate dehydratase-2